MKRMAILCGDDIPGATARRCVEFQDTAAAFAYDAQYFVEHGILGAAANAQRHAKQYHEAAWDRLARLIGVE